MASSVYRFGPFELDASAYQLRREGVEVRLEHRPMDLLICLVERCGALVSRDEIVARLWGPDVFVDVESGIHTAVRKIRRALQDSPKQPEYVVTVAGKGYRFAGAITLEGESTPPGCIAVLPMQSLDANPDSQYLADGITEEIIAALGHCAPRDLRVLGRTTMMRYRGGSKSLAAVAAETNAAYLVESSLRCEDESIRVVARLIEAKDQTQLWGGTFDGERRESVLALQRELSGAVASQVKSRLSGVLPDTFARRQPSNAQAYDLYLRGRYLWHQLSGESTRRAIEHFQRAATLDANYALAWAGIAVCFSAAPITGDASSLQVLAPARNAAAKAAEQEPQLAETHTAAGFVQFWLEWNFVKAEEAFRRALQLDPSDGLAHRTLAIVLAYQHRHEEARDSARIACELDPLNAANFALASQVEAFARDWQRARQFAHRAIETDPGHWVGYLQLAQASERLGNYADALSALAQPSALAANNSKVSGLRGYIEGVTGQTEAARETLRLLAQLRSQRFVPPYAEACVWLGLGDLEQTASCLERCIEVHDVHLNFLLADAKWDPVRAQPWFVDLLSRCGFTLSHPGSRLATGR